MQKLIVSLALTLAASAGAQEGWSVQGGSAGFEFNGPALGAPQALPQIPVEATASYTIAYRPNADGFTLVKVVGPDGVRVRIFDRTQLVTSDVVPLACAARPGHVYRVALRRQTGEVFEKNVRARAGLTAVLYVGQAPPQFATWSGAPQPPSQAPQPPGPPPPPMGPRPMGDRSFNQLSSAISTEPFPANKIDVLRTAAQSAYFTCAQVGQLVDLFDFPSDKVKVVALTKDRLVDRQNGFTLYAHFAFPGDKDRVRQLLGN